MKLLALRASARMARVLYFKNTQPGPHREHWLDARWLWPKADPYPSYSMDFDWTLGHGPWFLKDTYNDMVSG